MLIMTASNKKWTVFRRGESLGTFTAAEIREELRKGVLSPNDFAAVENSVVRQEIIEIDEIFWTGKGGTAGVIDSVAKSRSSRDRLEESIDSIPVTRPRNAKLYPVVDRPGNQERRGLARMGAIKAREQIINTNGGRRISPGEVLLWGAVTAFLVAGIVYFLRNRLPTP
jgi:hypothetical protein